MKRSRFCLLGFAIFISSIVGYWLLSNPPTQVVHQNVSCPTTATTPAQEFQVLSTHRWSKGVIVLYSALCPSQASGNQMQRVLGHQVMQRDGMGWQVSSSDSYRQNSSERSPEKLIEYRANQVRQPDRGTRTTQYTILYGQLLSSKVGAVEATFDNGKIVRDTGTDGVFALISEGASQVCELRIFGKDNQILRIESFIMPDSDLLPKKLVNHRRSKGTVCIATPHPL